MIQVKCREAKAYYNPKRNGRSKENKAGRVGASGAYKAYVSIATTKANAGIRS